MVWRNLTPAAFFIHILKDENKKLIGQRGAISLIADAMRVHPSEEMIQQYACRAFWNLSFDGMLLCNWAIR